MLIHTLFRDRAVPHPLWCCCEPLQPLRTPPCRAGCIVRHHVFILPLSGFSRKIACTSHLSCCCDKIFDKCNLGRGGARFGSWSEGTVHRGREVMAARVWGSWSWCIHRRSKEQCMLVLKSFSPFLFSPGPQPMEWRHRI